MLPKKNRADKKAVEAVFKGGKSVHSSILSFKFLLTGEKNAPRVSLVAPKAVSPSAIKRNLLRRQGYLALQKYFKRLPQGIVGVFIYKQYSEDLSLIQNDIEKILNKIN